MDDSAAAILARLGPLLPGRVEFALVFGSILAPQFNEESDLDLAVFPMATDGLTMDRWSLRRDLGECTDRDLDLIDLRTADPIITMQVLANGRLIYAADVPTFHLFKARRISEYFDFKRSREVVERAILKRRIYA